MLERFAGDLVGQIVSRLRLVDMEPRPQGVSQQAWEASQLAEVLDGLGLLPKGVSIDEAIQDGVW